jgi:excisionase family DNA binding protein
MIGEVLTSTEVARQLHVSLKTVQRMAADGRLHPVGKLPGRAGAFLFDQAEVNKLARTPPTWPKYSSEREKAS